MHLIKVTKDALRELREIDRQWDDPAYWERLIEAHCEKPSEKTETT